MTTMSWTALADSELPVEKGIAMIVFFGAIALFATVAVFLPGEKLQACAGFIGTQNPLVARIVCILGAIVGWGAVAVTVASLSGAL